MNFPTKIIFPEEDNREVEVDLNGSTGGSDNIYDADVSEEDIAPTEIFKYEIISDAETGATSLDSLPTKEARIIGIKEKYCNGGYEAVTGEQYENTNYEIVLDDGSKILDTLIIPYQVEINGEMYKITEVDLAVQWGIGYYTLPDVKTIIYPNTVEIINANSRFTARDPGKKCNVEKIVFSKNLKIIGSNAFVWCDRLNDIEIPSGVTSIEDSAFYKCSSLTSINIPNSVTSIGDSAFYECSGLTSISIQNGVTSIGNSAFSNCSGLTSINIPNSVTSIGDFAFSDCSGLTSINIPNSVTNIGGWAFSGCSSLTSIEIPSGVTNIENAVFYGCSTLTSINIPSTVTKIGEQAFDGCDSLTNINIPVSVTSIGDMAFYYCSSLTTVNYTGTMEQWQQINIGNYRDGNSYLINATIICTDGTLNP